MFQRRLWRFLLRHEQEPWASMVHDDRLREPHAGRGVLQAATLGRLKERPGRYADRASYSYSHARRSCGAVGLILLTSHNCALTIAR
jgi:hypothetical protein